MRSTTTYIISLLAALSLIHCGDISPSASQVSTDSDSKMSQTTYFKTQFDPETCEEGELLVLPKEGHEAKNLRALQGRTMFVKHLSPRLQNAKAKKVTHALHRIEHIKLPQGNAAIEGLLEELQNDPNVAFAECVKTYSITAIPNDPQYGELWGVQRIDSEKAWDQVEGDGVIVGVIDSGINLAHPDLINNLWTNENEIPNNGLDDDQNGLIDDVYGYNFDGNTSNPDDDNGHGTHCAGTIAATGNNNQGVIGVAPKAKLMAIKSMNAAGSGSEIAIANGIRYGVDNGAKILNLSLGGGGISNTMCMAINYARTNEVLPVVASGNNGFSLDQNDITPAECLGSYVVGATTPSDQRATFSNYGTRLNIAAPGVAILSTWLGNTFNSIQGTSMATPHVAGVAALIASANAPLKADLIEQILNESAEDLGTPGKDIFFGMGIVDAEAAVALASSPDYTNPIVDATTLETVIETDVFLPVSFTFAAQSPNGAEISYSVENLPEGATFDETTGELEWTPTNEAFAENSVKFVAISETGSTEHDLSILVNGGVVQQTAINADFVSSQFGCQSSGSNGSTSLLILLLISLLCLRKRSLSFKF